MPAAVPLLDLDDEPFLVRNGKLVHGHRERPALMCRYLLRVVESEQDVLLDLLHRRLLVNLCILDIEPHEIRRIAYLCAVCQRHSQQQDVPVDEDVSDLELHAGVLVLQSQVQGNPLRDCLPDPFLLFA